MSILKVANIHFEAAGTKRIDYLNDDVLRISFGETVLSGNARFNGNGATKLSVGTTAQRPTGESGLIRFNTQVGSFEGHNGSAWGSIGGEVDLTPANNYSREVGAAANGWANTISATRTDAANTLSLTRASAANGWANTVASASAVAANTLSATRTDAANGWANTISLTRASAANIWTNTVFGYSNTKFLSNSSGVVFNGTLNFLDGNVHINRTNSTVGNNVRLDVNGAINASAVLVNGAAISSSIPTSIVTATTQAAVKDNRYILVNAAATTVTLPGSPVLGDTVYIIVSNNLANNIVSRNGNRIMGLLEDMTLDIINQSIGFVYANTALGWRIT